MPENKNKRVCLYDWASTFLIGNYEFAPLGVLYLSAWLKQQGHDVKIIHGQIEDIPAGYDVYGVSSTTPQYPTSKRALRHIKQIAPEVITVIGGAHVNAAKCQLECIDDGWDYVVLGEGETTLSKIVAGELASGVYTGEVIKDHRDIPIPDYGAIDLKKYGYPLNNGVLAATINSARGCPFQCQFCSSANGIARWNPVDRVLEEVDLLVNKYGFRALLFVDDVFTLKYTTRMKDLVSELGKFNIAWRCYSRTDLPIEWLEFMAKNGCVEVGAGVESGNQGILDRIMKRTTVQGNIQFVRDCKRVGIQANSFLMIGLPGESEETIADTRRWVEDAMPEKLGYNIFVPYPDTPIVQNYEAFKDQITLYDMPYEKAICKSKRIEECFVSTPYLFRQEIIEHYYNNFEYFVNITGFDPRKRGQRAYEYAAT